MLKKLYIKDYAIVDQLEVLFDRGLQVVTGETGAGKSIVIGALGILCGERAQSDLVRSGAPKAVIEAEFTKPADDEFQQILHSIDFENTDGTLILRREITAKGTSRAFINDSPVNISNLGRISSHLLDMHGQHQHQRLFHPENHLSYLDAFGKLENDLAAYQVEYTTYITAKNDLDELLKMQQSGEEKRDLFSFQLNELDNVNVKENELDLLRKERLKLENQEILFSAANDVSEGLYLSEDSTLQHLMKALTRLKQVADIDKDFAEILGSLETARVSIEEAGRFCEEYATTLEFEPERLEEIRNRESELDWLLKKYKMKNLGDLITYREDIRKQLLGVDNFAEKVERINETLESQRKSAQVKAVQLSEKREQTARKFEQSLLPLLRSVGLENAEFKIELNRIKDKNGIVKIDGNCYQLTPQGLDEAEFQVGLNIGEPARPLHKVASGGEVSRIMLCIKDLLAGGDAVDTLVFDEIDSGISGRHAQIVGRRMQQIARRHQLIVITHLPQIAAQADVQYSVQKSEDKGRTKVEVKKLNSEERINEIAKLLGGEQITAHAIANAREMILGEV